MRTDPEALPLLRPCRARAEMTSPTLLCSLSAKCFAAANVLINCQRATHDRIEQRNLPASPHKSYVTLSSPAREILGKDICAGGLQLQFPRVIVGVAGEKAFPAASELAASR